MIETDRDETKNILDGKANAISRVYFDKGRPIGRPGYQIGERLELSVSIPTPKGNKDTIRVYATATAVSMREESIRKRKEDTDINDEMAEGEGYSSALAWRHAFTQRYGEALEGLVWRIQFKIEEIRK